jgi:hypothetical protein
MARPNPAIAQRKSDPNNTQIIALGRVVACRALLVVTSTLFGIAILPEGFCLDDVAGSGVHQLNPRQDLARFP